MTYVLLLPSIPGLIPFGVICIFMIPNANLVLDVSKFTALCVPRLSVPLMRKYVYKSLRIRAGEFYQNHHARDGAATALGVCSWFWASSFCCRSSISASNFVTVSFASSRNFSCDKCD